MQTETLNNLRHLARCLADLPYGGVRSTALEMIRLIDHQSEVPVKVVARNLREERTSVLLKEITRRVDKARAALQRARQTDIPCRSCKMRPVRAHDLCTACYHREWRRKTRQ